MVVIVAGPSSVGKSTYIERTFLPEHGENDEGTLVLFPHDTPDDLHAPRRDSDIVFHYNILRPRYSMLHPEPSTSGPEPEGFWAKAKRLVPTAALGYGSRRAYAFARDWSLQRFLAATQGQDRKAVILIADGPVLGERLRERRELERIREDQRTTPYDSRLWRNVYEGVDLAQLYLRFCEELERWRVPYELRLVDEAGRYPLLARDKMWIRNNRVMFGLAWASIGSPTTSGEGWFGQGLRSVRRRVRASYAMGSSRLRSTFWTSRRVLLTSRRVLLRSLRKLRRRYRVLMRSLGPPPHSRTGDRSATASIVFGNRRFEGRSVLDIGCAEGSFCFEAEKSGAIRVVGYELDPDRYEEAIALKGQLESDVEFVLGDAEAQVEIGDGSFDVVLLLNVLHHLHDPIATLRRFQRVARECLVIEYATLDDPKFRRFSGVSTRLRRQALRAPLMGVSSLEGEGQTFLFTDAALEVLLTDHVDLAQKIDFYDSPIKGRRIALCWRKRGSG